MENEIQTFYDDAYFMSHPSPEDEYIFNETIINRYIKSDDFMDKILALRLIKSVPFKFTDKREYLEAVLDFDRFLTD